MADKVINFVDITVGTPYRGAMTDVPTVDVDLPASLVVEPRGPVTVLTLDRASKRNALDDATVLGFERFFSSLDESVRVVVLNATGDHFCAGLDLSALGETTTFEGVKHSRMWHRAFERIESSGVPVISVLRGAVIGGGLELATATHIRVAEQSAYYALPEGKRGLFVGGGASVRVPRLIGAHRVADMMLTGRVLSSDEGHAFGLSNYLVDERSGLGSGIGTGGERRRELPDHELRRRARVAPHRRLGPHRGVHDRVADGRDLARLRRGEAADAGVPRGFRSAGPTRSERLVSDGGIILWAPSARRSRTRSDR